MIRKDPAAQAPGLESNSPAARADRKTPSSRSKALLLVVALVLLAEAGAIALWLTRSEGPSVGLRLPTEDEKPRASAAKADDPARNAGTLLRGPGTPSGIAGSWPQYLGPARSGVAPASEKFPARFPAGGLPVLWRTAVCDGYAAPVVGDGRVFLIDYDRAKMEDAIRCMSLDDGREIWRYSYYVAVKYNHGMSRTVPALSGDHLVTLGPKCHVTCLNAKTGEPVWKMDLVREFGVKVPDWYAGQCPLIDGDVAILAPCGNPLAGPDGKPVAAPGGHPLMIAVELKTGKVRWKAPNPGGWKMSHSSVAAMDRGGRRQYVYVACGGVAGVSATDGSILWTHADWRVTFPIGAPLVIDSDRFFLAGQYGPAPCALFRLTGDDKIKIEEVFRLKDDVFGSKQQTPVFHEGHIYSIVQNGELACLDLEGRRRWSSGSALRFGYGPLLIADGKVLALTEKEGMLHVFEASPAACKELDRTRVLTGHDAMAPMVLVSGRLIVRDMTQLVCLDVSGK